ncbi:flagellar hook-associated protein FlgK [Acutalibacter muris]|uniref:flagellar hook-associated protein FlgK n=2 Tax=Acutalibacter muris TaxID=1796620 RepID=UPI00272E0411|nr:flagellar basal body rod C-terminal domain-containing protein [Acutalibacter muris]
MSTVSTFSGFTMARLGIMASSKAMEVTGNNISNINTVGYTRQSLDQRALYIGGADVYASQFDVRVGAGALTTGVSQLRDPYLDIRFRNENAQVGFYEGKYSILERLSIIFDEVGKGEEDGGVLEQQFNKLLEELQVMNTEHAGDKSYDASVRGAAQNMVQKFHAYADALDRVLKNTTEEFKENIGKVNSILKSIRELNESIKKAEISSGAISDAERKEGMIGERGQQALELRDQRNVLIDELSKLIPIDVKYSDESIGAGMTVEKLTITLKGNSDAVLVDGVYFGQISVQEDPKKPGSGEEDPYLRLQISVLENNLGQKMAKNKPGGEIYKIGDQELKGGTIQAQREMLTKTGEYSPAGDVTMDAAATTKRGIRYYQNVLDALARKTAEIFNKANTTDKDGFLLVDANGNGIQYNGPNPATDADKADINNYQQTADGKPLINGAGVLFSSEGDGDNPNGITASNIAISYSWSHEEAHIIQTRDPAKNGLSTANDNIIHLIAQMQANQDFKPSDILADNHNPRPGSPANSDTVFFSGSLQGMLTYINNNLGGDKKTTMEVLDNYYSSAEELDLGRMSVSGVDLNDEAISMMQFQKSYSASCRLLTTLDEILDKLINGTGIAGR